MKQIPQDVSESTKRRNPHLYYPLRVEVKKDGSMEWRDDDPKPKKRLRQSTKPLMNKLEQNCFDHLSVQGRKLHAQAVTFRLANGVRYTPDIICFCYPWRDEDRVVVWEVKGPWMTDDAVVKLKVFANSYRNITVLLASQSDVHGWTFQEVWA